MKQEHNFEKWFSAERLVPYRAIDPDPEKIAALYEWNAQLSAAFWRTLGHVEVLLRNALHDQLSSWSRQVHGDERWYVKVAPSLVPAACQAVKDARSKATRKGRVETPGRVVAELGFGFWRYLLSAKYERLLWLPCLRYAFPHLKGMRKKAEWPIIELHLLRNRIGHQEPIHHLPIEQLDYKARRVAGWIDPAAQRWIALGDKVPQLLQQRPLGSTALPFL